MYAKDSGYKKATTKKSNKGSIFVLYIKHLFVVVVFCCARLVDAILQNLPIFLHLVFSVLCIYVFNVYFE